MAKARRVYLCRSCGSVHPRWMGKCPDCGTWDALEETTLDPMTSQDPHKGLAVAAADIQGGNALAGPEPAAGARALSEIDEAAAPLPRRRKFWPRPCLRRRPSRRAAGSAAGVPQSR